MLLREYILDTLAILEEQSSCLAHNTTTSFNPSNIKDGSFEDIFPMASCMGTNDCLNDEELIS